ncbi:hypothetical protein [Flavobacterium covae]
MFDKICIKNKESENYKLDIGFVIDTMLFYGKVILLVHKEEIKILLNFFGEDLLKELIKTRRIELRFRENLIGSMIFPDGKYNIDTFTSKEITLESVLYEAHRSTVNNSIRNQKFTDEFSNLIEPYSYSKDVREAIISDFSNESLLKRALPIYIESIVPQYKHPEIIEIEIIKDGGFGPYDAYSLKTNIDLTELNKIHKQNNPEVTYDINYSGFLQSIAESKGDIHIVSELESEIVTSELYSKFIALEVEDIIKQRTKSEGELKLFNEYVLTNCLSLGKAYLNNVINGKELLKIFEKADKFRYWLKKIPEDKNLLGEYYKAVLKEKISDKLPTKTARFVLFEGIGITLDLLGTGGLGTLAGTALSVADNFLLDKIINKGWRPNQFIDKSLKPKIKI